jgi:hypothetical protein
MNPESGTHDAMVFLPMAFRYEMAAGDNRV